jgi:hypothetical protein
MELLRYALHLNTKKLKVNRFVFGLNNSLHAKVRILMPQTLHDVVQKALIAEEELISGGQTRTPARPAGQVSSGTQQHQTPVRHTLGYHGFQRGSTFTTPRRPPPQQRTPYRGPPHQQQCRPQQQKFRPVQQHRPGFQAGGLIIFYFGYQDYWAEEGVLDVWGATLPARLSCGEDQSVWISRTHYSGRYGQGPSDSCSSE